MERMLSGIKPTGRLTLGNYIGAISQFVQFQDEYELYIFIANQHAITIPIEAKELRKNTKDLIALYLASGLDPNKVTIFLQSDVAAHAKLGWVMTCMSYMGELQRMTQYKDKVAKQETGITAGLFTYPCLMAADILLYDPKYVPVGIDQKQHVELARNLAERFNNRYSDTFTIPEPKMTTVGQKIYSLQDPTKKMSKSETNPKARELWLGIGGATRHPAPEKQGETGAPPGPEDRQQDGADPAAAPLRGLPAGAGPAGRVPHRPGADLRGDDRHSGHRLPGRVHLCSDPPAAHGSPDGGAGRAGFCRVDRALVFVPGHGPPPRPGGGQTGRTEIRRDLRSLCKRAQPALKWPAPASNNRRPRPYTLCTGGAFCGLRPADTSCPAGF